MYKLKKMLMLICALALLLVFIICIVPYEMKKSNRNINSEKHSVEFTIYRSDRSIKDENGDIQAYIYYDKPIFSGGKENVMRKINDFFNNDCKEWYGVEETKHKRIKSYYSYDSFRKLALDNINNAKNSNAIKEQPFKHIVNTKIIFVNEKIVSVLQSYSFGTMGPRSVFYYGSTFDLKTGEQIAFDEISNFEFESFEKKIVPFLVEKMSEYYPYKKDIELYYSKYNNINSIENKDKKYNYYYDGTSFYLINNDTAFVHSGIIIKWNGKYDKPNFHILLMK